MLIKHKDFVSEIELNDIDTASQIGQALPIEASAQIWQEEVYFEIPVAREQENGVEKVEQGDATYWPPGRCFCVFFGRTQPVSAVTVVGRVESNLERFREVRGGDKLLLDKD